MNRTAKARVRAQPEERTPPHSVEGEQGVLGSMLTRYGGTEAIPEVMAKIDQEHFYVPAHRTIFIVICDLYDAGQQIELILFTQILRDKNLLDSVGGAAAVTNLFMFVPTAANVQHYLDIVRDKYALREAVAIGTEIVRRAYEEQENPHAVFDEAESKIASIRSLHGRNGHLPPMEDAAELIARTADLPPDVVEGILHRGAKMVLGGASKSFKTWTLIDLAISVASGSAWLGNFSTKRGRVLYMNLELQAAFFTQRLQAVCDKNQVKLEPGYLTPWNLRGRACDLSDLLPLLLRQIGRDNYVLIIIDPIYKLLGGKRDENKAGDIASLLNEIEKLAVVTGAAVAFGAHYSKGNQAGKEVIDRIGGSGVFARDPDSILNFTRHEEEDCFTVEATLRNHPRVKPFVVRWEYPLMCIDSVLDPDQLKQAGAAVKQYHSSDLLEILSRPMSTAEFKKTAKVETGMSERTFYRLYGELKESETLTLDQEGRWNR